MGDPVPSSGSEIRFHKPTTHTNPNKDRGHAKGTHTHKGHTHTGARDRRRESPRRGHAKGTHTQGTGGGEGIPTHKPLGIRRRESPRRGHTKGTHKGQAVETHTGAKVTMTQEVMQRS